MTGYPDQSGGPRLMMLLRTIAVLLILFGGLGPVSGQNILRNGDFRQGALYWYSIANNNTQADFRLVPGPQVGDSALQAGVRQLGANAWDAQSIHDDYNCQAGQTYTIRLMARSVGAAGRLRLVMQDTSYSAHDVSTTTSWALYSWQLTAPEGGLQFKIHWLALGTYQISNIRIEPTQAPVVPILPDSLKRPAGVLGLTIGAALDPVLLSTERPYERLYNQQFGGVVAENVMKMATTWPARGVYDFFLADSLVRYARRNNKTIRGHALLWHASLPSWLAAGNYPADTLRKLLKGYTKTVVSRYRGQIAEWDVVNEAIDDQAPHNLRSNFIYTTLGPAILDSMFVWAHEADPAALLFYNDYSIEFTSPKANMMLSVLNGMKLRGIPVHGVGFQCHFDHNVPASFFAAVQTMVGRAAGIGLRVSFTEVDFAIRTPIIAADYTQQAHAYAQLLRIALGASSTVKSFYLWGFTDRHSWIPSFWAGQGTPKDDALVLDRNYLPKPAYDSLMAVLNQRMAVGLPAPETQRLRVWPNPAQTVVQLCGLTMAPDQQPMPEVVLTNQLGQQWRLQLTADHTLLIGGLPAGLYHGQLGQRRFRFVRE